MLILNRKIITNAHLIFRIVGFSLGGTSIRTHISAGKNENVPCVTRRAPELTLTFRAEDQKSD